MSDVTQAQRDAAAKVIEHWDSQQKAKAKAAEEADRERRRVAVDSWMAEKGDLTEWALEQWRRDKAAGYGRGMTPDTAITYSLGSLRLAAKMVQSVDDFVARRDTKDPTP